MAPERASILQVLPGRVNRTSAGRRLEARTSKRTLGDQKRSFPIPFGTTIMSTDVIAATAVFQVKALKFRARAERESQDRQRKYSHQGNTRFHGSNNHFGFRSAMNFSRAALSQTQDLLKNVVFCERFAPPAQRV